jgi:hypothetical protein
MGHNIRTDQEKAMHLIAIMQGQPPEFCTASLQKQGMVIVEVLEGCYRDHKLASAYCSQLKSQDLAEQQVSARVCCQH